MNTVLINDLIEQHGDNYLECTGCKICKKIQTLIHERTPAEKFKHILDKGMDMTINEVKFLLENDVDKRELKKAWKAHNNMFYAIMKDLGYTEVRT
jgi:hypothetical protein